MANEATNLTLTRIYQIKTVRLAGRAARLFRAWGNRTLADAAHSRKVQLQIELRGGRARYNHQ
jgi:hypothetical protein